nr:hypothetical protein CFP56_01025 [Quercus suber]
MLLSIRFSCEKGKLYQSYCYLRFRTGRAFECQQSRCAFTCHAGRQHDLFISHPRLYTFDTTNPSAVVELARSQELYKFVVVMGYLTTAIAAIAANASNLRPVTELPDISTFDLLLPRCVDHMASKYAPKKKSQHLAKPKIDPITSYTIRKDQRGKKQIVAHRSKLGDKNDDGPSKPDLPARQFTADEDATLKDLKAKHMSYKNIAQEMKRTVKQIKTRCHELNIGGTETGLNEKQKIFTADDDAKLKNMVAQGASWPVIAREVKCAINQLKNRLKEIDPEAADKAEQMEVHGQSQKKDRKQVKYAQATDAHNTDTPASSKASSSGSEVRFTMDEWNALQNDELFSFDELQLLSDIMSRHENQTWSFVASRFFDATGRRVHPDDIREKFERMAHMGGS